MTFNTHHQRTRTRMRSTHSFQRNTSSKSPSPISESDGLPLHKDNIDSASFSQQKCFKWSSNLQIIYR